MKDKIWTEDIWKFAENRLDSRRYLLLPKIANLIKSWNCRSVFDYGCGEGYLFENFDGFELDKVGIYDINSDIQGLAVKNLKGLGMSNIDILDVSNASNGQYDCVVSSLVLMTVDTDQEYEYILNTANRFKTKTGYVIIAITHPCFRHELFSTHHTEYTSGRQYNYFTKHEPFKVYLQSSSLNNYIQFEDFHHNLSYTFEKIHQSGLTVVNLIELKDESANDSYYNSNFSPYMILVCK